jgi:hypothetical protein
VAEAKKRCENCWVEVEKELGTCPNCSHEFPVEKPAETKSVELLLQEVLDNSSRRAIGRPFKFILVFLLSFIAVLSFMAVEGLRLSGGTDTNYLLGDVVLVSLVALVIALVIIFLDYIGND